VTSPPCAALRQGDVAAFVVEPIQGKGVYMAPASYWTEVEALCRQHGTLLVMDEVQTGMGRTGRFFCHQHWDLQPDIITVSKALSGGYMPVGAVLCTTKVFDGVYSSMDRAVVHSSTFSKNQLSMVAALATLQVMDDEDIVGRAARNGADDGGPAAAGRQVRAAPRGAGHGPDDRALVRPPSRAADGPGSA
jgi:ornithine--oxo-acid transaminase